MDIKHVFDVSFIGQQLQEEIMQAFYNQAPICFNSMPRAQRVLRQYLENVAAESTLSNCFRQIDINLCYEKPSPKQSNLIRDTLNVAEGIQQGLLFQIKIAGEDLRFKEHFDVLNLTLKSLANTGHLVKLTIVYSPTQSRTMGLNAWINELTAFPGNLDHSSFL
ncbi:hypothetical protein BU23DRAFT_571689 [Bimuria novae-zelandiae CBS 107.79]|uniref:Uncharacterized protein n=1 Tax=Bimuria novae-zelandiae CBS 107.79 TaxID=1447943 RepID=A0A6A5V2Q4_9PLEO|nr:hypothetical protein BU23DRAFT_571689 [Bimuria novae-zelandiae CBS 107.79]